MRNLCMADRQQPLLAATRESPCTATKTQDSQKINTHINYPKFFILKNKENTTRVTGYEHICYKLAGTSDFSGLTHFIRRATPSSKMVIENALSPYERPVWKLMENGVGRGSWDQVRSRGLSPATHRPRTQPLPSLWCSCPTRSAAQGAPCLCSYCQVLVGLKALQLAFPRCPQ